MRRVEWERGLSTSRMVFLVSDRWVKCVVRLVRLHTTEFYFFEEKMRQCRDRAVSRVGLPGSGPEGTIGDIDGKLRVPRSRIPGTLRTIVRFLVVLEYCLMLVPVWVRRDDGRRLARIERLLVGGRGSRRYADGRGSWSRGHR